MNKNRIFMLSIFFILSSFLLTGKWTFAQENQKDYIKAILKENFSVQLGDKKEGTLYKNYPFVLSTSNQSEYFIQWGNQEVQVPTNLIELNDAEKITITTELENATNYLYSSDIIPLYTENNLVFAEIEPDIKYPILEETTDSYKVLLGNYPVLVKKSNKILIENDTTSSSPNETDTLNNKETGTDTEKTENSQSPVVNNTPITSTTEKQPQEETILKPVNTQTTSNTREFSLQDKFFQVIEDNVAVFDNSSGSLVKVGELLKGQIYTRISDYGNWHRVKFGNGYGYILKSSTQPIDSPNISNLNTGLKNSGTLVKGLENLTVYDNTSGNLVPFANIESTKLYPIIGDYGNWYRIDVLGRIGYVYKPTTILPFKPTDRYFSVLTDNLPVYDNSSGTLVEVGSLVKGQSYPRVSDYGNWHQIQFGNGYGYVWRGDTKPTTGTGIKNLNSSNYKGSDSFIAIGSLPVFDNTSGELVQFATLKENTKYPLIANEGNWYKIDVSGRIGYVYKYSTKIGFKPSNRFFKVIADDVKIFANDTGELLEVGSLEKGQVYPRFSDYGNWHQIQFANGFGYVWADSTTPDSGTILKNISSTITNNYTKGIINSNTPVFDNTSGELIPFATINQGVSYSYSSNYGDNWLVVDVSGREGFIYKGNLSIGLAVATPSLEVYSSYNELANYTQQNSNTFLKLGDRVEILAKNNYGAQIRTIDGSITGWVQKEYLDDNLSDNWWYLKEGRNIRASYSSKSGDLGYLAGNTAVRVLDYTIGNDPDPGIMGWYRIQMSDGKEGWIWGNSVNGANIIRFEKEKVGAKTNEVTIFTPLNTLSTITASQINQFIHNITNGNTSSYMYNMGDAYIAAQQQTGLNAIYLLAHSSLETGYGTSSIVKEKYNYFGISAFDACPSECASTFDGKSAGIINGAKWISNSYINRAAYQQFTLDNMRNNSNTHQYATDEAWHVKITDIAKKFLDFIKL